MRGASDIGTKNKELILAIIGGGRWGRIIISMLSNISHPFNRVVVVSKNNVEAITSLLVQLHITGLSFNIVPSIDELFAHYEIHAAVVVNAAHQHFNTALYLIEKGVNVLIEKPIVLSSEHIRILINKALTKGVCIVPGLQYRFCSYIHNFADQLNLAKGKPVHFLVEWSDSINEIRYGEVKTYDDSIDVAQDVMPHIWSILTTIFPKSALNVQACQSTHLNRFASFSVEVGDLQGRVLLERDALQRRRFITIHFDTHESLSIDFTSEPGVIFLNSETISGDPEWENILRPLTRQFYYFLSTISQGATVESDVHACVASVFFSENASRLLKESRTISAISNQ